VVVTPRTKWPWLRPSGIDPGNQGALEASGIFHGQWAVNVASPHICHSCRTEQNQVILDLGLPFVELSLIPGSSEDPSCGHGAPRMNDAWQEP
jgi:hypothetical protein